MRVLTKVADMQRLAKRWRAQKVRVGFVPTMGCLHPGHISLIHRARQAAGTRGRLVVSIYVNPTQFGANEDLNRYPRDLERDRRLCRAAGVDVIFAPDDAQMYPDRESGLYSTYVVEESLSTGMEGSARPDHFRGVATVVAKLFNIVLPDIAVFGAKDFQQAAVVRRMARDLNFPVKIIVATTVREPDGLAMSSRNNYLDGTLRAQATALWQAIQKARGLVRGARRPVGVAALKKDLRKLIERQPTARVDYIEVFDSTTLRPLASLRRGAHLALAVFIGKTRLIDNAELWT